MNCDDFSCLIFHVEQPAFCVWPLFAPQAITFITIPNCCPFFLILEGDLHCCRSQFVPCDQIEGSCTAYVCFFSKGSCTFFVLAWNRLRTCSPNATATAKLIVLSSSLARKIQDKSHCPVTHAAVPTCHHLKRRPDLPAPPHHINGSHRTVQIERGPAQCRPIRILAALPCRDPEGPAGDVRTVRARLPRRPRPSPLTPSRGPLAQRVLLVRRLPNYSRPCASSH